MPSEPPTLKQSRTDTPLAFDFFSHHMLGLNNRSLWLNIMLSGYKQRPLPQISDGNLTYSNEMAVHHCLWSFSCLFCQYKWHKSLFNQLRICGTVFSVRVKHLFSSPNNEVGRKSLENPAIIASCWLHPTETTVSLLELCLVCMWADSLNTLNPTTGYNSV